MILGIPLAIWFGILTIVSVFITAFFGVAMHVFRKNVFGYHKFFAALTVILAVVHATLAFLLWFYAVTI
jgi:hypothetical protein